MFQGNISMTKKKKEDGLNCKIRKPIDGVPSPNPATEEAEMLHDSSAARGQERVRAHSRLSEHGSGLL